MEKNCDLEPIWERLHKTPFAGTLWEFIIIPCCCSAGLPSAPSASSDSTSPAGKNTRPASNHDHSDALHRCLKGCVTPTDLLNLRHFVRQHPDTRLPLRPGLQENLSGGQTAAVSRRRDSNLHSGGPRGRCRTLMTSTFSSVGVTSCNVSSRPPGFCGSTTATLPSCTQAADKRNPVNVPFRRRRTAPSSTNGLAPCCRRVAPWCSWTYRGRAEGVRGTDVGPGNEKTRKLVTGCNKSGLREEGRKTTNQWRERRARLRTKVIAEKQGGAWKIKKNTQGHA